MRFLRVLLLQLRRALLNPVFFAAVGIFAAAVTVPGSFVLRGEFADVVYAFDFSLMSMSTLVITMLPLLPFALSYQSERREHSLRFYYVRVGVAEYTFAKFIATVAAGFCVVFLGYALYIGVLSIFFPLNIAEASHSHNSFTVFFEEGKYFLYLLCRVYGYSTSGALCAGLGLWFSTYIREKYVTVILPFFAYMLLLFVFQQIGVPHEFYPTEWLLTEMDLGTPMLSIVVKTVIVLGVLSIACFDTVRHVERSALNE